MDVQIRQAKLQSIVQEVAFGLSEAVSQTCLKSVDYNKQTAGKLFRANHET